MMRLEVSCPWTPWLIPVQAGRRLYYVNLTPNRLKDLAYTRSIFRRHLALGAQQQSATDAWAAAREALEGVQEPRSASKALRVDVAVTVVSRTRANRDGDGAISGLKWAFDGIAAALGCNDSVFRHAPVTFEKGQPETRFILTWEER